jgi:Imm-5 like putative immunity protein
MSDTASHSQKTRQQVPQLEFEGSQNIEWHSKHTMPKNPNLDQRARWYIEHARNCPCTSSGGIPEEIKKRYMGTHQEFWMFFNRNDHKALALWAADCAEHVLPLFEEKYPQDTRPRDAVRTLREWVHTGKFSMPVIRGASLAAHAAAREVKEEDKAASFAAHAAGQAVATAHVPTHALGPVLYAIKAVAATNPTDYKAAIAKERDWQAKRLPENLREWVDSSVKQAQQLLPKNLRNLV